jgi:hypothetical protein
MEVIRLILPLSILPPFDSVLFYYDFYRKVCIYGGSFCEYDVYLIFGYAKAVVQLTHLYPLWNQGVSFGNID